MKYKDLIKFIQDNKMEEKSLGALLVCNGGVWAESIKKAELSCPEDDCVFLRIEIPKTYLEQKIEYKKEKCPRCGDIHLNACIKE